MQPLQRVRVQEELFSPFASTSLDHLLILGSYNGPRAPLPVGMAIPGVGWGEGATPAQREGGGALPLPTGKRQPGAARSSKDIFMVLGKSNFLMISMEQRAAHPQSDSLITNYQELIAKSWHSCHKRCV